MTGEPIDIVSGIPLLVGIVGSAADAAPPDPALAAAVAEALGTLRARAPQTLLVAISPLTAAAEVEAARAARAAGVPLVACVAAGDAAPDVGDLPVSWTRIVTGDPRQFVALASDLLLVVANGAAPAELRALVTQRTTGEPRPADRPVLAALDGGPCVTIAGGDVATTYPQQDEEEPDGEAAFAEALRSRNRFNLDLAAVTVVATGTPIERLRARIAAVTTALQNRTNLTQRTLYLLAFVAAATQIVVPGGHTWGVLVKYLPVAIAFGVYFVVRRRKYQSRYQDYRAISEALRVQAAWSSVGISDSVDEGYLPMQQTDLQWIRTVLRVVHALDPQPAAADGCEVVRRWVAGQRDYFATHAHSEAVARDGFERAAAVCGVISVVASLAALALVALPGVGAAPSGPAVKEALGATAGLTALLVAIGRSYLRTRGHLENANRYERMFFVFDRAGRVLANAPGDLTQARAVATELGRLALSEHAEWLLGQRERPIALVTTSAA